MPWLATAGSQAATTAAPRNGEIGGDFGERQEHEGAQMQARMRQGQARQVELDVVVEQQVEVEGARPVPVAADASETGFDVEQRVEQGFGRQRGFQQPRRR